MSETTTRAAEGHMARFPRQSETCFVYNLKKKEKRSGIISKNKTQVPESTRSDFT